jgi:ActR/RegA family two-component response regulator
VTHDQHLLIADTPEEFASACARLMTDRGLRERLVDNAFAFLEAEHSIARARSVLHSLYAP